MGVMAVVWRGSGCAEGFVGDGDDVLLSVVVMVVVAVMVSDVMVPSIFFPPFGVSFISKGL